MRMRDMLWTLGSVLGLGCTSGPGAEPAPAKVVTLLHTSDLHSRVWPFQARITSFEAELSLGDAGTLQEVGGLARLATLLASERRRTKDAVWLDSGDALEGAEVFQRFAGKAEIELLGALGLSAMALGNHELSLGVGDLARRADEARFPMLAANLSPRPGSPLAGRLTASSLVRASGLWLGVIGVANPRSPPNLAEPDNPWQLEVASDTANAVQAAIDQLVPRAALVIVLSHLGLDGDRDLVEGTTGIDVVLGGHQHIVTDPAEWVDDCAAPALRRTRGCAPRRVAIVHSGAYGKWLTRVELALEAQREGYEIQSLELSRSATHEEVRPSAALLEALETLELPSEAPLAFAPRRIARRAALGGDAPLGNLATDAVLRWTEADVVLLNTSGLRADLEGGLVSRAELTLVFPFSEPWRLGLVPGAALRRGLSKAARRSAARECTSVLQVAGLRLRLRCGACADEACVDAWRGERPLDERALLLVALPEYLAAPGADFEELLGVTRRVDIDMVAALQTELAARARALDDACAVAAQQLSDSRCRAMFGAASCPVTPQLARAVCSELPRAEGGRDGRIEMVR